MKAIKNKAMNFMTGRDLKTVLHPTTDIRNEITLSTEKGFHYHSYVLNVDDLEFTDNNTIMTRLPKQSNIKDVVPVLDWVKNDIKGDKLSTKGDEYIKTMWVDRFNRTFASKIETPDQINVSIRADVVSYLFLKKKAFAQCTTGTCDIVMPSTSYIDFRNFLPTDPTKKSKPVLSS